MAPCRGIRDGFLWAWAPVLLWLVVIGFTSGAVGARAHSDVWIWRVMHEWLPRVLGLEPSTGAPSFLPAWVRTGSPRDVLIDMLGAAAGVVVAVLVWRRRRVPPATG